MCEVSIILGMIYLKQWTKMIEMLVFYLSNTSYMADTLLQLCWICNVLDDSKSPTTN